MTTHISFVIPNPFKTVPLERVMAALADIPYYREIHPIHYGITRHGTVLIPHENTYEREERRYVGWICRSKFSVVPEQRVSYIQSPTGWLAGEAHIDSDTDLYTALDKCIKELSRHLHTDEVYEYTFPQEDWYDDVWVGRLVGANTSGGGLQVPYIPVKVNGEKTDETPTLTCLPNPYIFPVADVLFAMWDANVHADICTPDGYRYIPVSHDDNDHAAFMVYKSGLELPYDVAPNGWIVSRADVGTTESKMEALAHRMSGEMWHRAVDPCYATYNVRGGVVILPTNPESYMVRIFPEYN